MTVGAVADEIVVAADRRHLRLVWRDGTEAMLAASALRAACRCGWCTRDQALGQFQAVSDHVTLAGAELLGSHGLHLKFSDGHERGIFPWPYLQDLCRPAMAIAAGPSRSSASALDPRS